MNQLNLKEKAALFQFEGAYLDGAPYGSGHINDTFLIRCAAEDGGVKRYILQRMNHHIFLHPDQLMENIVGVTSFLRNKILENGGDSQRETMNLIPTQSGAPYCQDEDGYWRAYLFIEGASTYDKVESPKDFYETAVAFGRFQRLLADYPAETLHETIVDFHNTPKRLERLKEAVQKDTLGRAKEVQEEIDFALAREADTHALLDLLREGKLPLRVTHNDTKLNNIMIDDMTKEAVCVIDLDTVMPGLSVNDFGDSIRFGASTGAEDEPDLSKVWLDLELFELYTKGFLKGCGGSLTEPELDMLPMGAKMMTLECGIRFLTDYLEGDTYFKISRPNHNLDRTRTQFKLVADMEQKWDQMAAIVDRYR